MTESEPLRPRRRNAPIAVRHGRQKKAHPLATVAKILTAVLGVFVVSIGSVAAIAAWDVARSVKPGIHLAQLPGHTQQAIPSVAAIQGGVNMLLTGTDTRTGQGGVYSSSSELEASSGAGNNDVNILIHIAQNHQSVTVVSIPRDLEVPIPACPNGNGGTYGASSQAMMNTTLSRGGLSCDVLTVEKLTGLSIPFAAEITFDGVSAMSNAVGGVTVCLATPVIDKYTTPALNLPAGQQTLVGATALSFLRSRHGVGDGSDLGRISNQQVFMSALARKIVSGGVLSNPFDMYPLAKAAVSNMTLSDTLTNPTTLVQIGLALKDVGLQNMVFLQYPAISDPEDPNRVIPDEAAASVLNDALVADQPVTLSGAPGRAAVLETPAPTPGATAPATTAPTPAATAPATGTSTSSSGAVVLPSSITGQTAAETTCTKGNN
jgi:LCP family protein required for cell wall assembly